MVVAAALTSCDDREDLDGTRRPIPGLANRPQAHQLLLDDRHEIACDLYASRAAATLVSGGALTIPAGSAAFSAYTEGGYQSPWNVAERVDGETAAVFTGVAGALSFPLDVDAGGAHLAGRPITIQLRARAAVADQLASVFLNEHKLGDVAMTDPAWRTYTLTAPAKAVVAGENSLRFYFKAAGTLAGHRSAAALAWIAVSGHDGAPAPAAIEAGPVAHGGEVMAALAVPASSRLSFFVRIPDADPSLVFAHTGAGEVKVQVAAGEGPAKVVYEAKNSAGWRDADVDLAAFAGTMARVDFLASDKTAWGHPVIASEASSAAKAPAAFADHVVVWAAEGLPATARGWISGQHVTFTSARSASSDAGRGHAALLSGSTAERGGRSLPALFRDAGFVTALVVSSGAAVPADVRDDFDRVIDVADARDAWSGVSELFAAKAAHTFLYVAQAKANREEKTGQQAGFLALMAGLESAKARERTAVILAGASASGEAELSLADRALRVALAIATPASIKPEVSEVKTAVSLTDVLPTALLLAGISPPPTIAGRSLLPLVAGASPPMPRAIFAELPGRSRALVLGDYKLVIPLAGPPKLYDLAADPGEARNLAGERAIALRRLRSVFGLVTAHRPWSRARWGQPGCPSAAFAADLGL